MTKNNQQNSQRQAATKSRIAGFVPKSASFVTTAVAPEHYPPTTLPEIAFVGRSNVGKSTLINLLAGKKSLARTSNTPGRTQAIQFFDIDGRFMFVDLPGYGFAQVPMAVKVSWDKMISSYLERRESLRVVILIVDARRDPTTDEDGLLDWLELHRRRVIVVVSKIDKIPKHARFGRLKAIASGLGIPDSAVFPFSGLTGDGRPDVWGAIFDVCDSAPVPEPTS
ncbi:MAG: YihA family ribosome biogenesis GTP-binding protein [Myxococcales bacterium]|nr:YihA family ribosome biogenesis GTP-binding protein [Myxococcales bacterium]